MSAGKTMQFIRVLLIGVGILAVAGSDCSPPPRSGSEQKKPEFASFSASPQEVCINLGLPIVRVNWSVTGGQTRSCLSNLSINGSQIDGDIWATGVQNGRCGEGDYSRESSFSLNSVFGNNIPSTITISGELTKQNQAGVFIGTEVLDTASATVTTDTCEAGIVPGG